MLVSVVGSPSSGKTTTAAKVFAWLKDQGALAEFITEQARLYIAEKKFSEATDKIILTDEDQIQIMERQLRVEELMKLSVSKETIIVSDSSSFNSLMYMSPIALESLEVKELTLKAQSIYDKIFYADPLDSFVSGDSNRITDENFSQEFHARIPFLKNLTGLQFAATLSGGSEKRMWSMLHPLLMGGGQ